MASENHVEMAEGNIVRAACGLSGDVCSTVTDLPLTLKITNLGQQDGSAGKGCQD